MIGIAMVVFFASYDFVKSDNGRWVAAALWTAFVIAWSLWLRSDRRAVPRATVDRRRAAGEWLVTFVVANLIVVVASRVSWTLVGVLLAVLGLGRAALAMWRSSRTARS